MPLIKKLVASKLKRGKGECFDEQPDENLSQTPSPSLKRTNARLRKNNLKASNDSPLDDIAPSEEERSVSALDSRAKQDNELLAVDYRRQYSWEPDLPGHLGIASASVESGEPQQAPFSVPDSATDTEQHVSSSSFLSRLTKRKMGKTTAKPDGNRPVDNFTKWDSRRYVSKPTMPSLLRPNVANSPYSKDGAAQWTWTNASDWDDEDFLSAREAQSNGEPVAIHDIDWSKYEQTDQLRQLIDLYVEEQQDHEQVQQRSPTDSGVCLDDEPASTSKGKGKGKKRAIESDNSSTEDQIDKILALELALRLEIDAQHREWADRAAALEIHKEEQLEHLRQDEEDRVRAKRIREEEERRARLRDCICCGDEKDVLEFSTEKFTALCDHPLSTCTACMRQWLATEVESKGSADLKCPECPQILSHGDVQTHASDETFAAYERLLTRHALGTLDEFSWCLSPTCASGQMNAENNHFMECAGCGYKQCLACQTAWHAGETCAAYRYRVSGQQERDERATEERATEAMIDRVSKRCPGGKCGWRIQKADGCDHMTCKKCKHEFCWECLAAHRQIRREGNTAHQEWCKFHTKNLGTDEMAWPFAAHR